MRLATQRAIELASRARVYLDQHPDVPVRLNDLARALSTSPSRLTYSFRTVHGVPLARYSLRARLARAAVLLPESDDLARLAVDLGFASHSHFSRTFARWTGLTPSAYRSCARAAAAGPSPLMLPGTASSSLQSNP